MTPEARRELDARRAPTAEEIEAFRRDGHVTLRGCVPADVVRAYRPRIVEAFERHRAPPRPMSERSSYGRAFAQVVNLGLLDGGVAQFAHARRFARLAAELLGVRGVRIFLDDSFFKEPGGGHTPWHQDASTMPFDVEHTGTLWIPLVDVTPEMGTMVFAAQSHRGGLVGPVDITDAHDAEFERVVAARGYPLHDTGPMRVGDASFHHGCTAHRAGRNVTDTLREVMAIHYFADGARVTPPDNPSRARLLEHFAPGLRPGDLAASPAWPLVYSADARE